MQKNIFLVILLFLFTLCFLFASCSGNGEKDRMEDLLNSRCTICHDLDSVRNKRLSEIEWRKVIDDMISQGARLEDVEKEDLIKYLSVEYGI